MRYFVLLTTSMAVMFGLQWFLLSISGGRFTKNESNFFSSLGRIQAGAREGTRIAFLGSSLTGRLPDRSHGYDGVANMGCDGGSAIDTLRAMDRGELPAAPHLVIEVNTLSRAVDASPSAIAKALGEPWFRIGMELPLLSASARPSGFLYSLLLKSKIGTFETGQATDLRVDTRPKLVEEPERDWNDDQEELIQEIAGIVQRLNQRGSNVIFVWLPPSRKSKGPPPSWMVAMATRSGAPWWDVGGEADPSLVTLTDGAHMTAPSAARTVNTIVKAITGRH